MNIKSNDLVVLGAGVEVGVVQACCTEGSAKVR